MAAADAGDGGPLVHTLVVARHATAILGSQREGDQVNNPPLSTEGEKQADALVGSLLPLLRQHQHGSISLVSSPMRRTLQTAAPIAAAAKRPLTVHGSLYEYDAKRPGSTVQQIQEELPVDATFLGFQDGQWDFRGDDEHESDDAVKARAGRVVQSVISTLLPSLGSEPGVLVLVSHQTFADLLLQLLVDGTDTKWRYGGARYKLRKAGHIRVEVTMRGQGQRPLFRLA